MLINFEYTGVAEFRVLDDSLVFFPFGYSGYNKLFVTPRTKYEVRLVKALRKLDRTTYLWKSNDTIILSLFSP
jgi:hypothetical protein